MADVADPRRKWRRAVSLALDKEGVDEHFSRSAIGYCRYPSAPSRCTEQTAVMVCEAGCPRLMVMESSTGVSLCSCHQPEYQLIW